MKHGLTAFAMVAILLLEAGCSSQPKEFTEKKSVIASGKTVRIKELGISITNKGCGRKWIAENGKPESEIPYCELIIKHGDSSLFTSAAFAPLYIGEAQVRMDKINPWGREEDSVPAGGCRVVVRRSPAFVLLEKYGWSPEKMLGETQLQFPDTFKGLPFVPYASATQAIGFDINSLAGQILPVLKIQLKEKGKRSGTNIWAHIVMDDGEATTGWLSSQVSTPGLAPLNISKDKLGNW